MSPWLFNKYINKLIELLERSDKLYKINYMSKGIMVNADDTNVIASHRRRLKQMPQHN